MEIADPTCTVPARRGLINILDITNTLKSVSEATLLLFLD